ncbi:HEL246Cp [Eremothecium sinecaudum]|uniref:HEL246Cp n=1 Tax=Eremothecium sinecaudum TaxID=45286 RepID=A0A0X8HTA5_9SACH|nr:HEL246Cp [Eremothecium sinecaudum]AMD21035.1 HEL246Cp [Eremothecium sinecaudum]
MAELRQLLTQINDSLGSTSSALTKLSDLNTAEEPDGPIHELKSRLGAESTVDKISLLSLKNASMLAYVDSLLSIVGEKLVSFDNATCEKGRARSVEHRVCLERGVRPLEKKLSYQIDKLTRAYNKFDKEYKDAQVRANEASETATGSEGDEADSEEEDELMFRPNVAGMVTGNTAAGNRSKGSAPAADTAAEGADNNGIYKPPKISAMRPPQHSHHFEDKFNAHEHKDKSRRSRMQAMEEYIRENADQPEWEASIGANIVDHGRSGVKSMRDTEREREIQQFEEDNFTRVNAIGNKAEKRKAKQRKRAAMANMISGEDFSIFNSKRQLEDSTSRRANKKPRSTWDRAKKRM